MPVIIVETVVRARIELVFDLSRSMDLHVDSQMKHREQAIAGRTSGLIGPGEEVTWQATHFGIRQKLRTRITKMDPPFFFRDAMVHGTLKHFDHDHFFVATKNGTLMKDRFAFSSPLGFLGRLADHLFLEAYMTRLLRERNATIKEAAETQAWQKYLPPSKAYVATVRNSYQP